MKRIAALILIGLVAFNWFGFRLVVGYMQQQSDICLEAVLDNAQYDESQLVEVKVPINMPYQTATGDYERFDGQVEYKGTFYKYVKRKIAHDTLYLKCISNNNRAKLELAKNDFFKNANDLGNKQQHSKSVALKNALSDYDNFIAVLPTVAVLPSKKNYTATSLQFYFPHPSIKFCGQPPDVA